MSGGVDSSVAAALLSRSGGFDVVGCFMKCWSAWDQCSVERDAEDARAVAEKLGIPFYIFDFEKEYREKVFNYMVREYAAGRTPNPDVLCNSEIKFGIFLEKALALGADFVATGHYVLARRHSILQTGRSRLQRCGPACVLGENSAPTLTAYKKGAEPRIFASESFSEQNAVSLYQAKDQNKDQSYFLWRLTQKQLLHAIFPIGDYLKSEVREMAREFGLPTAEKKDSQGLCFVGKVPFDEFLRELLPKNPGPIITTGGRTIGEHDGLSFYTLGQRHGIKIGGGVPYYVAEKEFKTNTLVVAEGNKDEMLFKKEIEVADINWIGGIEPKLSLECEARIRYRQPLQKCHIISAEPSRFSRVSVVFDEPQKAATPGQSAVFYADGAILGGGVIV